MNRRCFLRTPLSFAAFQSIGNSAELDTDIAICGAGVGGCAAALAALRNGMRVVMTEETDWIGGQLTSQAVPPDEHPWIELFGCTRSYRSYRNAVRDFYRAHYPLSDPARTALDLNPGNGSVSRLAHEPRVSLAVLQNMLAPYSSEGRLNVLLEHVPASASLAGDFVRAVTVGDLRDGRPRTITAKYFLDATETGDLLPLTRTEFACGAEARSQTGELHAPEQPSRANNQAFTFCFAMDYLVDEDHTIDKPRDYAEWRDYIPQLAPPWTGPLLSWSMPDPKNLKKRDVSFEPNPRPGAESASLNLWTYRRIIDRANFQADAYHSDICLVNWPQNDFWRGDLLTATADQRQEFVRRAKQLSLSLLYWMQTQGWKGLRLRNDIVGTADGLAKAPYIRESRRIQAEFTVLEEHVGATMRTALQKKGGDVTAANFADSVGIGCYRIDLHPSAGGTNYIDISSLPFQIPLGALLPKRVENLLPACKNIGTTHITNGCYRLHPVEWNIGEAAGALAAHAIKIAKIPRAIRHNPGLLADFQANLRRQGFELEWPKVHAV